MIGAGELRGRKIVRSDDELAVGKALTDRRGALWHRGGGPGLRRQRVRVRVGVQRGSEGPVSAQCGADSLCLAPFWRACRARQRPAAPHRRRHHGHAVEGATARPPDGAGCSAWQAVSASALSFTVFFAVPGFVLLPRGLLRCPAAAPKGGPIPPPKRPRNPGYPPTFLPFP